MQQPNPLSPAVVLQSELSYGWHWREYAGRQMPDGDWPVFLRGSTYLRWIRRGYWEAAWNRYCRLYKLTILYARDLMRRMDVFVATAERHLKRKLGTHFRPVELFYPCQIDSFGVQGSLTACQLRFVIIEGRLKSVAGEKLKVMAVLARQLKRADR